MTFLRVNDIQCIPTALASTSFHHISTPRRKWYVSFAEYSLFYRALLQKRPIIVLLLSHIYPSARTHWPQWQQRCRHMTTPPCCSVLQRVASRNSQKSARCSICYVKSLWSWVWEFFYVYMACRGNTCTLASAPIATHMNPRELILSHVDPRELLLSHIILSLYHSMRWLWLVGSIKL